MERSYEFYYNKFEIGAGIGGSSMGIDPLTLASISMGSYFFEHPSVTDKDQNYLLIQANTFKRAKYIDVLA